MEKRWVWPFELLDKIGEGGMGVVYRARYVGNDRQVAVKLLPPDADKNKTLLARFEREMEVLKQLRHPNIVHCFGGTCESKEWFYAMELIEGGTLADVIHAKGRLSWDSAVDYAIQMCDALDYAHERGIIHRDVKPSNFLMTKQQQLKLSDFGLVTIVAGHRLTATGRTLGTADYMSPEQIRGKPPLTPRSDLYALGCVMYEMFTGDPPYQGSNPIEVMHKHLKEPVPRLSKKGFDGPPELDELVAQLMSKTPDERPESAARVGEFLRDVLQPGRRMASVEPTLMPQWTTVSAKVPKLKGIKSSESLPEIATVESWRPASVWWLVATAALGVVSLVCFAGWTAASARARQTEQLLVNDLMSGDPPSAIYAARMLNRIKTLRPATISKLNEATKAGPDDVRIAALAALAKHPSESRGLVWEIYKLQKNSDFSPFVRNEAEKTHAVLKAAQEGTSSISFVFWGIVLLILGTVVGAGWWIFRQVDTALNKTKPTVSTLPRAASE